MIHIQRAVGGVQVTAFPQSCQFLEEKTKNENKICALGQPTRWSGLAWSGLAWLWETIDRYDRPPISQSAGGPDLVTCQVERWRVSEQRRRRRKRETNKKRIGDGGVQRWRGYKQIQAAVIPHVHQAWVTCRSVHEALHYKNLRVWGWQMCTQRICDWIGD